MNEAPAVATKEAAVKEGTVIMNTMSTSGVTLMSGDHPATFVVVRRGASHYFAPDRRTFSFSFTSSGSRRTGGTAAAIKAAPATFEIAPLSGDAT